MKAFRIFACLSIAVLTALGAKSQTVITQSMLPLYITTQGSYILTSNLSLSVASEYAITVNASNVTINMNGFNLSGPLSCTKTGCSSNTYTSIGIAAFSGTSNITVENGSVNGFTFGVYIGTGNVHNMNVSNNDYGIYAQGALVDHNVVTNNAGWGLIDYTGVARDNVVSNNDYGIFGSGSTLVNNTSASNTYFGLEIYTGYAAGNTLVYNGTDVSYGSSTVGLNLNACTAGAC